MNKMLKLKLIFVTLSCCGLIMYLLFYFHQYSISNNQSALESHFKEWLKNESKEYEPKILDVRQLDKSNSYLVLFETKDKNQIGYARYLKGWNGKFKPDNYHFGTEKVRFEEIDTNIGKFGIVLGLNPALKINHIKAPIVDEALSFTFKVSEDQWFFRYKKIPKDINHQVFSNLELFDKNNKELEYTELF
ncbi:MAG: hypothetical protein ABF649_04350 [Bacillus sp. (in: firmicutes)]